jgi:hypothetical protein
VLSATGPRSCSTRSSPRRSNHLIAWKTVPRQAVQIRPRAVRGSRRAAQVDVQVTYCRRRDARGVGRVALPFGRHGSLGRSARLVILETRGTAAEEAEAKHNERARAATRCGGPSRGSIERPEEAIVAAQDAGVVPLIRRAGRRARPFGADPGGREGGVGGAEGRAPEIPEETPGAGSRTGWTSTASSQGILRRFAPQDDVPGSVSAPIARLLTIAKIPSGEYAASASVKVVFWERVVTRLPLVMSTVRKRNRKVRAPARLAALEAGSGGCFVRGRTAPYLRSPVRSVQHG